MNKTFLSTVKKTVSLTNDILQDVMIGIYDIHWICSWKIGWNQDNILIVKADSFPQVSLQIQHTSLWSDVKCCHILNEIQSKWHEWTPTLSKTTTASCTVLLLVVWGSSTNMGCKISTLTLHFLHPFMIVTQVYKAVPAHAMKLYWGSRHKLHSFLTPSLDTGYVINFTLRPLYRRERSVVPME